MAGWLAPIFGVVIIGVIIELVSKNSPTGRFVRAVYSFFVLFVIIEPLPRLLGGLDFESGDLGVNADLLDDITAGTDASRRADIESALDAIGFGGAIVTVSGDSVYINTGRNLSDEDIIKIKQAVGGDKVYII